MLAQEHDVCVCVCCVCVCVCVCVAAVVGKDFMPGHLEVCGCRSTCENHVCKVWKHLVQGFASEEPSRVLVKGFPLV